MSDYWLKEAERRGDEINDYTSWIESNTDCIIEAYGQQLTDYPEYIYEGVLDDDYPKAEDNYIENLCMDDVDDDFISDMFNKYLENGERD